MNHDFSELHPHMASRERGWNPIPNPLAPQPPRRAYGHSVKHIFLQADQLLYDVDSITGLIDRTARIAHNDTEVVTSESDTYRPMFFRWFDKYIANVEHCLSAFVLKPEASPVSTTLRSGTSGRFLFLCPTIGMPPSTTPLSRLFISTSLTALYTSISPSRSPHATLALSTARSPLKKALPTYEPSPAESYPAQSISI